MAISLSPTRFQCADHYCVSYAVVLPSEHSLEDAQAPEYWSHVASKLRQHDTIRLIPEDGSYFAELVVVTAGRAFAKVKLLRHVPLFDEVVADAASSDADDPVLTDHIVKWGGPHDRYTVLRKSDNEKLKTGFVEKPAAQRWLDDHLASMAR